MAHSSINTIRKIKYCLLLLCVYVQATAQHVVDDRKFPDSLQQVLKTSKALNKRLDALFLLSDFYSTRDTAKALDFARQGIELSKRDEYLSGVAHFYLAGVYFECNVDRSQQEYMYAEKLLRPFLQKEALIYRSRAWNNYGALEQRKDKPREFLDILINKVLPLAQQAGDSTRMALSYHNIGLVLLNLNENARSLQYFSRAIAIMESGKQVYADLADTYVMSARATILSGQPQQALPFLQKAKKILEPNPDSYFWPLYYSVEGAYYRNMHGYTLAHESLEKGLAVANRMSDVFEKRALLYEQFNVYKDEKNYPAARNMLQQGLEMENSFPLSKNKKQLLFDLAETEKLSGNTAAAYGYLMQYAVLSDSIYANQTKNEVDALEARFRTAEQEKLIGNLEHEKKERKFFILLLLAAVAVLSLIAIITIMRLQYRKKITARREAAHQAELERKEKEKQLSNYTALMEGQEQERQRMARDLHDGLGCQLAAIKLGLTRIPAANDPQELSLLQVTDQLDASIRELRWISRNMMPESLLTLGLQDALKDLCSSVMSPQLRLVYNAYNIDPALPLNTQTMIYRMVQEIITNAVKHARASTILLQCSQEEDSFFITVEDNGKGFDVTNHQSDGIGLKNIRNRVDYFHGHLHIESSPEGTIINIELHVAQPS
ncbi:histidine kinase [Niastella koreensis]|uniref:Histidine kinase n=2 Tax=Niastella koreensis TaxID=354356 RepID=A0ABX3NSC0_9BACT|nr:sensor histidine kinase [Niastella koreensis]AEV97771.1 putative signal transduction histidine kinase [Niastella koreensis GR20-10]OQP40417.1 histidine kinase [Niastella koreensis]